MRGYGCAVPWLVHRFSSWLGREQRPLPPLAVHGASRCEVAPLVTHTAQAPSALASAAARAGSRMWAQLWPTSVAPCGTWDLPGTGMGPVSLHWQADS